MALPKEIADVFSTLLPDLGLTSSEAKVFTHLIVLGKPQRVTQVAKKLKMNRTALYGVLKTLSQRGLVTSVTERGTLLYRSIQPYQLDNYIERAEHELASHRAKVKHVIPLIQQLRTRGLYPTPTVQFFEGAEGLKQAYEDTIKGNPSKVICGFAGVGAMYKSLENEWIRDYLKRRTQAKVFWSAVVSESEASHKQKALDTKECRVTKILPPGFDLDVEIAAYENKVLMNTYVEDHPSAILIEDARIAEAMKTIFRYIDGTLEK